jgi:hypothetical protein
MLEVGRGETTPIPEEFIVTSPWRRPKTTEDYRASREEEEEEEDNHFSEWRRIAEE